MMLSILRYILPIVTVASVVEAKAPDISNLNNCINEVRQSNAVAPAVPTFDKYKKDYLKLIADLEAATSSLPYVYQEAAARPLIQKLKSMGNVQFLRIFNFPATDGLTQALQQIIPDAALSILFHNSIYVQSVDAFQEVVSDLYDSFISDEKRVSMETGIPIDLPTYGVIPPLVKFGNAENGPYTWPCDATMQLLGMKCPIVSLPPAQLKGGLLAWSSLGHETGGHDVLHADQGLLEELAKKVHDAVLSSSKSEALAAYWASCIDETASDIKGYLHLGPSAGIGLIGYFRALGNGKLRNVGLKGDPHPIDLLRGHLAAAVVKRLNFKAATLWSQTLTAETLKDSNDLFFVDQRGVYSVFPVSLSVAVASADVVAEVVMKSKLVSLQGHSLQEIKNWTDNDQAIVKTLAKILKVNGQLPANLHGTGFYAAHVVSASTLAGLRTNANISGIFNKMLSFLQTMHLENPTWSKTPTVQAIRLLESAGVETAVDKIILENLMPRSAIMQLPEDNSVQEENLLVENF